MQFPQTSISRNIYHHWTWIAVVATLALIPACSQPSPAQPGAVTNAAGQPAAAASSTVELRVYGDNSASNEQVLTTLTAGFTSKNPNIKVKVYQFSDYPDRQIPDLVKAGTPPDLIMSDVGLTPYLVETDLVRNLREFMSGDAQFSLDSLEESALRAGRVNGNSDVYVLPTAMDDVVLFYNKDMFKKAGVPEPGAEMTWDDLVAACKKLQTANSGVLCLGTGFAWAWQNWYPWVRGYGGDIMSADGTRSTYGSPETATALHAYIDLWSKAHIAQSPDEASIDCFARQKCAVTFGLSTLSLQYQQKLAFNWATQMMPKFPKGRFTLFGSNGFGIAKAAAHPGEAWLLLKYLVSPEAQALAVSAGLGLPVLKTAYSSLPSEYGVFVKSMDSAVRAPDYPNACGNLYFGTAQSVASTALQNASKGYASLEEGLKLADSRMNDCLATKKP